MPPPLQVRTRLRLGGAAIDADEASFGHAVVEIEVMCDTAEQVSRPLKSEPKG